MERTSDVKDQPDDVRYLTHLWTVSMIYACCILFSTALGEGRRAKMKGRVYDGLTAVMHFQMIGMGN